VVALGAAATGVSYDLLGGADTLILSGAGDNALTVSNIETVTGGKSADTVTLSTSNTVIAVSGLERAPST
jgi:Ca2+-binding RTX toxin-like protein